MRYAVAHATKGTTFVVCEQDGKLTFTRLREDPVRPLAKGEKTNFISQLKQGDEIFLELGGVADKLALAAIAFGATVYRYPSFLLGPDRVQSICDQAQITIEDERPFGDETSTELTSRKTRAYALYALARTDDNGFVKTEPRDVSLLQLKMTYRAYARAQRAAMRAYQGLLAAYRDQAFIALALERQNAAQATAEAIHNVVVQTLAEDMLGGDISETERADFFALVGRVFGGILPERATEDQIKQLIEGLIESDRFASTIFKRLKEQQNHIKVLLSGRPKRTRKGVTLQAIPANEIWGKVFEPLVGCGPLISARLISEIGDIRRFRDLPSLKAFAGYHHFEDGSRARRQKGHASNWSRDLKQGVWLWCDQTVKRPNSPWRARLDQRKAYELVNILRARQETARQDKETRDIEILPAAFLDRSITCVNDVTVADLATLQAHVDALRKRAGVTSEAESADSTNGEEKEPAVKEPKLAKLVRGVKMQAHQKALRWLGQQFLKHIFREWRKAIGLSEDVPRQPKPIAGLAITQRSADREQPARGDFKPVQFANT